jgi:hypothetical protein
MKTSKQYDVEEMKALGGLRFWESRPEFMSDSFEGKALRALIFLVRHDNEVYQKFLNTYSSEVKCTMTWGKLPKLPNG